MKDGTAQGVAKARDYEALWSPQQRLFYDPYARYMYPGATFQALMGKSLIRGLYNLLGPGILEMLLIRTKWLDEEVLKYAPSMKNMILLGAGYDTRGFRLALPRKDFQVWEVDQPKVQQSKVTKLERVAKKDATVAELKDSYVQFVAVDFNHDSLDEKLRERDDFQPNRPSLILLEGVTQYIPKTATAETLQKLKSLVAPGSIILMSYVDQRVFDAPEQVGPIRSIQSLLKLAAKVGEPWISGWTEPDFKEFMDKLGFDVLENTTCKDYNVAYMRPLGREMTPAKMTSAERFVTARLRGE
ncbi:MAG: SAM-dependent methyltransferase [Polyangiaceae bacterium]|nr:SAM-dependent methyltransferase [Polyangiaceae bacterium]